MVALLSRDAELYSTREIRRAFESQGYEVRLFDVLQLEVKIGHGVFYRGELIRPTFVIPRFASQLLIAGLAVLREWESQGIPILNSSQSLQIAHDQLSTLQVLTQSGLPIPETSFCSQPSDPETYRSLSQGLPKVIKLLDSSQGRGVILAPEQLTVKSTLSALAFLQKSGITQTFHPEVEGRDYRLLVLNGRVIKAVTRAARQDFRANHHQGGSIATHTPTKEESSLALNAVSALGLSFAGVDLLPTSQGCLILEVNASPGLEGIEQGERGSVARLLPSLYPHNR